MSNDQLLAWVDSETFGLDPRKCPIIELGFRVTDLKFNTIAEKSWLIWSGMHDIALKYLHERARVGEEGSQIVLDMHNKSGLFKEAKKHGKLRGFVAEEAEKWLLEQDATGLPMCGSSIQFDRSFLAAQMPFVEAKFHYRNIDVSTLKEVYRRYSPQFFSARPPDNDKGHRVMDDLDFSIAEFKYYVSGMPWS